MRILVTDWGEAEQVLPLALKYQVGMELLEFAVPNNLDHSATQLEAIRKNVSSLPLLSVHGPFSELVPPSRDNKIVKVVHNRFKQAYEIAQSVNAQHLIFHSGFIPKTYPREEWIHYSSVFWIKFLADKPIEKMIHIENVYEDDYTALLELIQRVNEKFQAEILSICLDIGHVNANSSRSLVDWIKGLGDHICYAHLHNNDGILDDHWRLDKGKIDARQGLELLTIHSPRSFWTIETVIEDIEPSLLWLQSQGYL